jgi:hypothetical protein
MIGAEAARGPAVAAPVADRPTDAAVMLEPGRPRAVRRAGIRRNHRISSFERMKQSAIRPDAAEARGQRGSVPGG